MSSAAHLRARLADAERRLAVAKEEAATAAKEVEFYRLLLEGLHSDDGGSRIGGKMQLATPPKSRRLKIAASSTEHESESKRILLAAGKSDLDIAEDLGVGRSTVRAWHSGDRPIPRRHAEALLKKYRVPLAAWPRILD